MLKVELLEDGEPVSDHTKVAPTNFQPSRVDNGTLGAKLEVQDASSFVSPWGTI